MGNTDQPQFETAKDIADTVIERFIQDTDEGGVDEIHIVYNRFVSLVTQSPEVVRVLPLEVVEGVEEPGNTEVFPLYEFEPEPEDVLNALLPVLLVPRCSEKRASFAPAWKTKAKRLCTTSLGVRLFRTLPSVSVRWRSRGWETPTSLSSKPPKTSLTP